MKTRGRPDDSFPRRTLEPVHDLQDQGRQWSRHAARYDDLFLDAFEPGVVNPVLAAPPAAEAQAAAG